MARSTSGTSGSAQGLNGITLSLVPFDANGTDPTLLFAPMSSDVRLGPVSYLVLGITALRGSTTPYQLKQFVQISIGHFWPFPHTQLYAEPARLAEAGLLDEAREESGRRRRHYTITAAGRERLEQWLAEPVTSPTEIRDLGLLKLFFSELTGTDEILELARQQAAAHRAKLAVYDEIRGHYADRPELANRLLSLELGTRLAMTAAGFWEDVQSAASASASTDSGGRPASMTTILSGSAAAKAS